METYYHGGEKSYEKLIPGNGVDGVGIYLTNDFNRAFMYASKRDGRDTNPHITEVDVDIENAKIWDDSSTKYSIKEFLKEHYTPSEFVKFDINNIMERDIKQFNLGNDAFSNKISMGAIRNSWIFSDGDKNDKLKSWGYQAIKAYSDLIVLDDKIIKYVGPMRDSTPLINAKSRKLNRLREDLDYATRSKYSEIEIEKIQSQIDSLANELGDNHKVSSLLHQLKVALGKIRMK